MSLVISINQPQPFPRIHLLARMLSADVNVILSGAQFNRAVDHARFFVWNQVSRQVDRISIPCSAPFPSSILDVKVRGHGRKIENKLNWVFRSCKYKDDAIAYFKEVSDCTILYALSADSMLQAMRSFGYQGEYFFESSRPEKVSGSQWCANLCYSLKADIYYCGKAGYESYLNLSDFNEAMEVVPQDIEIPPYVEGRDVSCSNLSVLDLVANLGWTEAKKYMEKLVCRWT